MYMKIYNNMNYIIYNVINNQTILYKYLLKSKWCHVVVGTCKTYTILPIDIRVGTILSHGSKTSSLIKLK